MVFTLYGGVNSEPGLLTLSSRNIDEHLGWLFRCQAGVASDHGDDRIREANVVLNVLNDDHRSHFFAAPLWNPGDNHIAFIESRNDSWDCLRTIRRRFPYLALPIHPDRLAAWQRWRAFHLLLSRCRRTRPFAVLVAHRLSSTQSERRACPRPAIHLSQGVFLAFERQERFLQ